MHKYYLANKERIQARGKEYYEKHREARLAHQKEYSQRPEVKAKHVEYQRKYVESHKAKYQAYRLQYNREYRIKNQEELAKKDKEYATKFPERIYAKNQARKIPLGPECEVCPETDTNTKNLLHHHPNYDEPLITVTVCASCHKYVGKTLIQEQGKDYMPESLIVAQHVWAMKV